MRYLVQIKKTSCADWTTLLVEADEDSAETAAAIALGHAHVTSARVIPLGRLPDITPPSISPTWALIRPLL